VILARTVAEARERIGDARSAGRRIGFVPTMGFLHEGHLSLVDAARKAEADFIVVSIFVNPKQFGPNEDFERYPRNEKKDRELLESRGIDLLFLPPVEEIYGDSFQTTVHVGGVSGPLEGARRPGHFDGVATVVLKLFDIVQADVAVFGRKDAQQCAVIERMVRDLAVPVQLVFGETSREHDGLALSSRNTYLSPEERALAPALHRALRAGEEAITHGVEDAPSVEKLMRRMVEETPGVEVDYLAVVDPETFESPATFKRDLLVVGAVRVGRTRLIDNIRIARSAIPHTTPERHG
jgi:pantoate--beta-alanine ligase